MLILTIDIINIIMYVVMKAGNRYTKLRSYFRACRGHQRPRHECGDSAEGDEEGQEDAGPGLHLLLAPVPGHLPAEDCQFHWPHLGS